MSQTQRHIKSQHNTTYEESYAIPKPTNATFISKDIMETDEEKERVRQTSKIVRNESKLA